MKSLRNWVFWPPFVLLIAAICYSLWRPADFVDQTHSVNAWILNHFGALFSWSGFIILVLCCLVCILPIGGVRIGGKNAKPLLSFGSWVAIALCTNTAVGILFWSTAEPIYHLISPPVSLGLIPGSHNAAVNAISTVMMHWSFIPCAFYTLPGLLFAFGFYNMKMPFSITSCLTPLIGRKGMKWASSPVDAICLYALVTGMAASLATGVLTIAGGMEHAWGIANTTTSKICIGTAIVTCFVASASSGLQKGIKFLSDVNVRMFFILAAFILFAGPTLAIVKFSLSGLNHLTHRFVEQSLFIGYLPDDPWPRDWTLFYWAVWLAWAPVTALFLGRIAYGYTIRKFVLTNLFIPAAFATLWMGIFSGSALSLELDSKIGLSALLKKSGPESIVYAVLEAYPYSKFMIPFFLLIVFIAYVTAADSNTTALAGISTDSVNTEEPDAGLALKVTWGVILGSMALIMLCLSGIDGVKTLSYLGGFPALLLEILMLGALIPICIFPHRYNWIDRKSANS